MASSSHAAEAQGQPSSDRRRSMRCWVWSPTSSVEEDDASSSSAAETQPEQHCGDKDQRTPECSARQVATHILSTLRAAEGRSRQNYRALMSDGEDCAKVMFASKFSDTRGEAFGEQVCEELDAIGFSELYEEYLESTPDLSVAGVDNISKAKGGSESALRTAMLRCIAHGLGFGPDGLAGSFLQDSEKKGLEGWMITARQELRTTGFMPGTSMLGGAAAARAAQDAKPYLWMDSVSHIQIRTCFIDDVCERFAAMHPQGSSSNIVLLGAGYDTRFYRLGFPPPERCHLYEVDAAGTQQRKLEILKKSIEDGVDGTPGDDDGISFRDTMERRMNDVTYVECDFSAGTTWLGCLQGHGINTAMPTLVVWEGVTMYLPREAVESTLTEFSEVFAAAPSAIVFDYANEGILADRLTMLQMKASGEPFLFGLDPGDMDALVQSKGLEVLDHISPAEGLKRYLPTRATDGTSIGIGGETRNLMLASNRALGPAKSSLVHHD